MAPAIPETDAPVRSTPAARKKARTLAIIAATRALFDARGTGDAQIEDIARHVGINRAIVYRHFTGKDELFALTLVTYLEELHDLLGTADSSATTPRARLQGLVETFCAYGHQYPAFVDCAQSLMRRPSPELIAEMSEEAALRLGRAMAAPLGLLAGVLRDGTTSGDFHVTDPEAQANFLYATALGALQLTSVGVLEERTPGMPVVRAITPEQTSTYLVHAALALSGRP